MPDHDLTKFQPTSDSVDDLQAALVSIKAACAAADARFTELTASRSHLLLSGSVADVRRCEAGIADEKIQIERLLAMRAAVEERLPNAGRAERIARLRIRISEVNQMAESLMARADDAWAVHAAPLAEIARLSAEHAAAKSALGSQLSAAIFAGELSSDEVSSLTQTPVAFHLELSIPGIVPMGSDGNDRAFARWWPEPAVRSVPSSPDCNPIFAQPSRGKSYTLPGPRLVGSTAR